jgi:magnesium transporter
MSRRRLSRTLLRRLATVHPRRRRTKVGLPPGTLVYTGPALGEPTRISLLCYGADGVEERDVTGVAALEDIARRNGDALTTWINVDGLEDTTVIADIGALFGIDPLVLEDVVRVGHRPKLETYDGYLYVVLRMFIDEPDADRVRHEQLSLILAPGLVITFQERAGDVLDSIRLRIREGKGRIRSWGADYLAYAIIDTVVDHYFVVLDRLSERVDVLEEVVVSAQDREIVTAIHGLKREHLFLRRAAWPTREVVAALLRTDSDLVADRLHPYLRDVYDHAVEIVDTIESLRDMLAGMLDIYLSSVSNRMNSVMKVLTIITTIFVPLTFIAGVYGMNFQHMPELKEAWAYPAVLALMGALAIGMLLIFRWKDWL